MPTADGVSLFSQFLQFIKHDWLLLSLLALIMFAFGALTLITQNCRFWGVLVLWCDLAFLIIILAFALSNTVWEI